MNDNEPVLYRDNFGLSEQPQKGLIERFIGNRLQSFAVWLIPYDDEIMTSNYPT